VQNECQVGGCSRRPDQPYLRQFLPADAISRKRTVAYTLICAGLLVRQNACNETLPGELCSDDDSVPCNSRKTENAKVTGVLKRAAVAESRNLQAKHERMINAAASDKQTTVFALLDRRDSSLECNGQRHTLTCHKATQVSYYRTYHQSNIRISYVHMRSSRTYNTTVCKRTIYTGSLQCWTCVHFC